MPPATPAQTTPGPIAAIINRVPIPRDLRCEQRQWDVFQRLMEANDYDAAREFLDDRSPERALLCQLGKPLKCDPGEVAFGVVGRCVPACARDNPCATGSCAADRGRFGCIAP